MLIFLSTGFQLFSQTDKTLLQVYQEYLEHYKTGDIVDAEKCLNILARHEEDLSIENKISIIINLGLINYYKGFYDLSINNYKEAEKLTIENKIDNHKRMGKVYNNMAIYIKCLGNTLRLLIIILRV